MKSAARSVIIGLQNGGEERKANGRGEGKGARAPRKGPEELLAADDDAARGGVAAAALCAALDGALSGGLGPGGSAGGPGAFSGAAPLEAQRGLGTLLPG